MRRDLGDQSGQGVPRRRLDRAVDSQFEHQPNAVIPANRASCRLGEVVEDRFCGVDAAAAGVGDIPRRRRAQRQRRQVGMQRTCSAVLHRSMRGHGDVEPFEGDGAGTARRTLRGVEGGIGAAEDGLRGGVDVGVDVDKPGEGGLSAVLFTRTIRCAIR